MPPVQTSYGERMPVGQAGGPAEGAYEADTCSVETAAGIGFGLACGRGSAADGAVLGGAQFRGISIRDVNVPASDSAPDKFPQYANIPLMTKGVIWVNAAVAVEAGQLVHYDTTTGALSNTGGTEIAGATWESDAGIGALAKLRLDGSLPSAAVGT